MIILSENSDNMNLKKTQIEILNLYRRNVFLSETIRGVSLKLKKGYDPIYNAIQELVEQGVLTLKDVGNSKACELQLSPKSMSILSFLDEQEAFEKKIPNMNKILGFKEFLDDIILVAGSYAKGTQTKKSDIDVVLIAKDNAFEKDKLLTTLTDLMTPDIHVIVFSHKDFIDMLIEKKASFGKEAYYNHLIFRNAGRYYTLLKEAIDNGFRN